MKESNIIEVLDAPAIEAMSAKDQEEILSNSLAGRSLAIFDDICDAVDAAFETKVLEGIEAELLMGTVFGANLRAFLKEETESGQARWLHPDVIGEERNADAKVLKTHGLLLYVDGSTLVLQTRYVDDQFEELGFALGVVDITALIPPAEEGH